MVGVFGEKTALAQANGPDVELVVSGTEFYATYETPDGWPALYDEALGLFCFAKIENGRFESTGVPVTAAPPPGLVLHGRESDAVRQEKIGARERHMDGRPGNDRKE